MENKEVDSNELIGPTILEIEEEIVDRSEYNDVSSILDRISEIAFRRQLILMKLDSDSRDAIITELEDYGFEVLRRYNKSILIQW